MTCCELLTPIELTTASGANCVAMEMAPLQSRGIWNKTAENDTPIHGFYLDAGLRQRSLNLRADTGNIVGNFHLNDALNILVAIKDRQAGRTDFLAQHIKRFIGERNDVRHFRISNESFGKCALQIDGIGFTDWHPKLLHLVAANEFDKLWCGFSYACHGAEGAKQHGAHQRD